MAEYIKRDNALKICDWYANEFAEAYIYFKELKMELKSLPAEDIHTVKHGRWVRDAVYVDETTGEPCLAWFCNQCGEPQMVGTNFCPNCGADMGETNDEKA